MAKFNLTEIFDYLDKQPEAVVMSRISSLYDSGRRGIFSEKFIGVLDLQTVGYKGFKAMVRNLYEIDPDFVERNRGELKELVASIKGE